MSRYVMRAHMMDGSVLSSAASEESEIPGGVGAAMARLRELLGGARGYMHMDLAGGGQMAAPLDKVCFVTLEPVEEVPDDGH